MKDVQDNCRRPLRESREDLNKQRYTVPGSWPRNLNISKMLKNNQNKSEKKKTKQKKKRSKLQEYIVQYREYSQYFIITINRV